MLVQALLAMLGSLYFSNFGDPLQGLFAGTGFDPCHLCRWGRILMYPLVAITAYALLRRDWKVAYLSGFMSLAGVILAGYHYVIQHQNSLNLFMCGAGNSCALMGWNIGFVTIPFLELLAFLLILVCSVTVIVRKK